VFLGMNVLERFVIKLDGPARTATIDLCILRPHDKAGVHASAGRNYRVRSAMRPAF